MDGNSSALTWRERDTMLRAAHRRWREAQRAEVARLLREQRDTRRAAAAARGEAVGGGWSGFGDVCDFLRDGDL